MARVIKGNAVYLVKVDPPLNIPVEVLPARHKNSKPGMFIRDERGDIILKYNNDKVELTYPLDRLEYDTRIFINGVEWKREVHLNAEQLEEFNKQPQQMALKRLRNFVNGLYQSFKFSPQLSTLIDQVAMNDFRRAFTKSYTNVNDLLIELLPLFPVNGFIDKNDLEYQQYILGKLLQRQLDKELWDIYNLFKQSE